MKSLDTKCVQAGYTPGNGEPRVAPIVQSTTWAYDTPEEMGDIFDLKQDGYLYSRLSNPTVGVLEEKVNALEGGVGAMATASGMSATLLAILNLADAGDNFISVSAIYGGTQNLFNVTLRRLGIECRFIEPGAMEADIEKLIDDKTKLVFCETIANPAGYIADFDMLSKICKKHGIVLMVDNTIATPYICRPFEFGANVVVHASTKYIDGHALCIGGVIVDGGNFKYLGNKRYPHFNEADESYHGMVFATDCGDQPYIVRARVVCMRDLGAQMSPMNAFLTNLGCETLHLRMPRHSKNGLAVAKALKAHKNVEWVKYAGLESDPDYAKCQKYFDKGYNSGMVTFGIKGGVEGGIKFQRNLKLFRIVTHIADARSCVLHPASTTHRQLSEESLKAAGVAPNLIRLSVGIEDTADVVADVVNALDSLDK